MLSCLPYKYLSEIKTSNISRTLTLLQVPQPLLQQTFQMFNLHFNSNIWGYPAKPTAAILKH